MKSFKKISSEEEYWKQHKKYKRKLKKLFHKAYKFLSRPDEFIEEFENMMAEMEFIGLVSPEWSQGQRERLYREMNKPTEFKEWVTQKKDETIAKIKQKLRR